MTVLTREFTTALELRDDDEGRTLVGLAVPYGVETRIAGRYLESFAPGAFADDTPNPGRVPLTATHPRDAGTLPIGRGVELREQADGLHSAWRISRTALGDEVLELARDGVPLGLSVGFIPVTDRGAETRGRVIRVKATSTTSPSSAPPPTQPPGSPPYATHTPPAHRCCAWHG